MNKQNCELQLFRTLILEVQSVATGRSVALFHIDTFDGKSNNSPGDTLRCDTNGVSGHAPLVLDDDAAGDAPQPVLLPRQAVNCQPGVPAGVRHPHPLDRLVILALGLQKARRTSTTVRTLFSSAAVKGIAWAGTQNAGRAKAQATGAATAPDA
ncbi:hypothetical protein Bpro_3405 [Polaromonas sp. JS666]|nr:hypothetical protein Bpro_3405 [Polaromonas sp. JS666]